MEEQQENTEQEQLFQGVPYFPKNIQNFSSSILSEHLKVDKMLDHIEKILFGFEMDENGEWKKIKVLVGYNKRGVAVYEDQQPLMESTRIRMVISYLRTMLNSNTFLTDIPDDSIINDMMFETSLMLSTIFYKIGDKIPIELMETMWGSIMNSIQLGLYRARGGRTLNAMTKSMQSHELIQKGEKPKDEFKLFG